MSLSNWNKNNILKFSIDNEFVDGSLTDFPVLLNLSATAGKNNFDCSDIFTTLSGVSNKKLAIVYPSVQEHWVEEYSDTYTKLLIHSNSNDNSVEFIDSSDSEHIITANGNVHHKIDQVKFGTTSVYFDGTSDYLQVASSDDFNLASAESIYTLDCWVYIFNNTVSKCIIANRPQTVQTGFEFLVNAEGNLQIYYTGGANVISSGTIPISAWTHIAAVSEFYSTNLYINGILDGSGDLSGGAVDSTDLYIGISEEGNTRPFHGYIDELRISRGVIRWTEDFTPPTVPYEKEATLKSYVHGEQEQLFCEIERWDQANEEAQLWVKVPKVLYDQPTDLLLYYDSSQEDNDSYVGDTTSWPAQQVWDDNFGAVYHMSQDPSTGGACILDSTSNAYHGTPYGSMTSNNLIGTSIGKMIDFDGSNDCIKIESSGTTFLNNTTSFTLEASGQSDNPVDYSPLISYRETNFCNICYHPTENSFSFYSPLVAHGSENYSVGYHTYAGYWNNSEAAKLFKDSSIIASSTDAPASNLIVDDYWYIGQDDYGGRFWRGTINEVRLSNIDRSDTWLKTSSYSNIDNLVNITQADIFQVNGYVKELGSPVQRQVCLYDRASGELMDKVVSNTLGYYSVRTTVSGVHNLICLDADITPDYEDLIISKVIPVETI